MKLLSLLLLCSLLAVGEAVLRCAAGTTRWGAPAPSRLEPCDEENDAKGHCCYRYRIVRGLTTYGCYSNEECPKEGRECLRDADGGDSCSCASRDGCNDFREYKTEDAKKPDAAPDDYMNFAHEDEELFKGLGKEL